MDDFFHGQLETGRPCRPATRSVPPASAPTTRGGRSADTIRSLSWVDDVAVSDDGVERVFPREHVGHSGEPMEPVEIPLLGAVGLPPLINGMRPVLPMISPLTKNNDGLSAVALLVRRGLGGDEGRSIDHGGVGLRSRVRRIERIDGIRSLAEAAFSRRVAGVASLCVIPEPPAECFRARHRWKTFRLPRRSRTSYAGRTGFYRR